MAGRVHLWRGLVLYQDRPCGAVDAIDCTGRAHFPILFLNGSEDNRDSEDRWLEACTRKKESKLIVYDGGDHFFARDSRFVVEVIHSFVLNNKD